jgi:hypothetical protein
MKTIYQVLIKTAIVFFACYHFGCLFSLKPVYYEDDKKVATQLVGEFHTYLDDGNYDAIYDLFSNKVRARQSKEQFIDKLKTFRAEVGKVKTTKNLKTDVTPQASFRIVHMIFSTQFENKLVFEEFDCLVDGQKATFDFYGHPEKVD